MKDRKCLHAIFALGDILGSEKLQLTGMLLVCNAHSRMPYAIVD